jgi:hypothetical protein
MGREFLLNMLRDQPVYACLVGIAPLLRVKAAMRLMAIVRLQSQLQQALAEIDTDTNLLRALLDRVVVNQRVFHLVFHFVFHHQLSLVDLCQR